MDPELCWVLGPSVDSIQSFVVSVVVPVVKGEDYSLVALLIEFKELIELQTHHKGI